MPRGGPQPGSGRPKGKKNAATLEKEKVMAAYRQRVFGLADRLLDSQLTLARGQSYLYRVRLYKEGKKDMRSKPELVTDPATIASYLNGEFEGMTDQFYYITTEKPDSRTIDSIMDRTFGKAVQPVGGSEDDPIRIKLDVGPALTKIYGGDE